MKKVVLLGAGNVAWSLANAIDSLDGYSLIQIYGLRIERAQEIAQESGRATATDDLSKINTSSDIYIIALKDEAIASVADMIQYNGDALWVHTSGSVPMSAISRLSPRHGVLYPLQTFSRGRQVDISEATIFTEGSDPITEKEIAGLARALTPHVMHADSMSRSRLHAAAVFACNFTNHLWTISADVLSKSDIPFSVMKPLIEETFKKAIQNGPEAGQTGPARRGDIATIRKHLEIVGPDYAPIYKLISQNIIDYYIPDEPNRL